MTSLPKLIKASTFLHAILYLYNPNLSYLELHLMQLCFSQLRVHILVHCLYNQGCHCSSSFSSALLNSSVSRLYIALYTMLHHSLDTAYTLGSFSIDNFKGYSLYRNIFCYKLQYRHASDLCIIYSTGLFIMKNNNSIFVKS
jgi:hypothetical protein